MVPKVSPSVPSSLVFQSFPPSITECADSLKAVLILVSKLSNVSITLPNLSLRSSKPNILPNFSDSSLSKGASTGFFIPKSIFCPTNSVADTLPLIMAIESRTAEENIRICSPAFTILESTTSRSLISF